MFGQDESAITLAEQKLREARQAAAEAEAELEAARTSDYVMISQSERATAGLASSVGHEETVYGGKDGDVDMFNGFCDSSQLPLLKGHCFECDRDFEHPSCVGYFLPDEPGFPFAALAEPVVQKAIAKKVPNIYDERRAVSVCLWCAGEKHGKKYYTEVEKDGKTTFKMTNEWSKNKRKSRGVGLSKHHQKMITKLHDLKHEGEDGFVSASQIYEAHQNELVKKANDWVTQLGGGPRPFLWLLYGCTICQMWTIGSNHWWRCLRRVAALTNNSTTAGQKEGQRRCCGCFSKWTWATSGSMWLFVVGFASESSGFEEGYEFALIGSSPQKDDGIDAKINFLKTATLLTELNGKPVSEETLLAALETIQQRVHDKFSKGMHEVSVEYSKQVSKHELDSANLDIICQDIRLSMPGPGRRMLVIKKEAIEKNGRKVVEIDPEEFHYLLDVAGSTYNIEDVKVGKGGKAIKTQILTSDGFKAGRVAIELCQASSSSLIEV